MESVPERDPVVPTENGQVPVDTQLQLPDKQEPYHGNTVDEEAVDETSAITNDYHDCNHDFSLFSAPIDLSNTDAPITSDASTYAQVAKYNGDAAENSGVLDSLSRGTHEQTSSSKPYSDEDAPAKKTEAGTESFACGNEKSYAEVLRDHIHDSVEDSHEARDTSRMAGRNSVNGWNRDALYTSSTHEKSRSEKQLASTDRAKPSRANHQPAPSRDRYYSDHGDQERDKNHGYQAAGIRFAPWNVPLKRRLQTLSVLLHSLSISTLVSVFFFLCAIPLTWPLLIPYLIHVLSSNAATDGRLRYRSERFRSLAMWKLFAGYFPAELHKTEDLPATRKYIFGYHPHGIISHGAWAAFATEALGFSEKFPGITNSLLTLDSNFRIPMYREYILAMGLRSVSKESIGNILTRGGPNNEGMGRAVTIVIGGARESLEAQPGTLRLILRERKGFVKLAVRTGADIVPVLAFGENELYDQISPKTHPWVHDIQMFVLRVWKFTLPFLHGRGIFNYDVGLMPYRHPLHIVVGAPVKVAQATGGNVDPAEVDRLHELYIEELQRIWDTHKDIFAKDRKEELQILK